MPKEPDWNDARRAYTNDYHILCRNFDLPLFYCNELILSPDESKAVYDLYSEVNIPNYFLVRMSIIQFWANASTF